MDGGYADLVIRILDNDRDKTVAFSDYLRHALDGLHFIAAERQGINAFVGQDDKLHQVDGIGAFTQDAALRSALAAIPEKGLHILKIKSSLIRGERLGRLEQFAVTCEDVAN